MNKITKDTTLAEILAIPGTDKVLAKHRVPCVTCPMAQFEIQQLKIGDVVKMYGIDLKGILKELNVLKKI